MMGSVAVPALHLALLTPTAGFPRWRHVAARELLLGSILKTPLRINDAPVETRVSTWWREGARVDESRNALAEDGIAAGADFLLWLDDDHTFPPDAFFRLMAHDLPIVGCNFRFRSADLHAETSAFNVVDGERRSVPPRPDGLEPVDYIGLGLCLMRSAVLRDLPKPWFVAGPRGEDGHLCDQLRSRGVRPVVDHGLSRECGHLGEVDLRFP